MRILYVEPFYSGSHKFFADQLKQYSTHDIMLLTLDGKYWKWRMYGAAVTLAQTFIDLEANPEAIVVTDMLDLPTFLGLIRRSIPDTVPIYIYFHENQIAYPWKEDSEDKRANRDLHYGMMNYHSALVADYVLFNSKHNKDSFLCGLGDILRKMPDHKHTFALETLEAKCEVVPLGLDLNAIKRPHLREQKQSHLNTSPLILWNHRFEHDKNPETFYEALCHLKSLNINFRLAVIGETYASMPEVFNKIKSEFSTHLIAFGYVPYEDYSLLLNQSDILPVTSNHDFFGISVMEAIHCGATPLLPNRLSYTELYQPTAHPEIFYHSKEELFVKLVDLCTQKMPRKTYAHLTEPYDWNNRIAFYDNLFKGHNDNTLR